MADRHRQARHSSLDWVALHGARSLQPLSGGKAEKRTFSSFDTPIGPPAEQRFGIGTMVFENAGVGQVLALYQDISGRTVIRGELPRPSISFRNQTPLNRIQALQLLDTVLAQNRIAMVLVEETAVKAVPAAIATNECPPSITLPLEALPDSGSCMTRTVQLKKARAAEVVPLVQPLSKLPYSIVCDSVRNRLILRDYSANIRRMLPVLQELEKNP